MARKANISKEEIIEACWNLIEQNTFPNIPRLSDYFKKLDGRGCSNTTLLNAISEWEEAYREHTTSELSDLSESIEPCIQRFQRDLIKSVSVVLDEKVRAHEDALALRKGALEGRSDSLHEAFTESQIQLEQQTQKSAELEKETARLQQENEHLKNQNDGMISRARVLESEIEQLKQKLQEADTRSHQAQVDLAKQDNKLSLLAEAHESAKEQIKQLQESKTQEYDAQITATLAKLKHLAKSLDNKRADR